MTAYSVDKVNDAEETNERVLDSKKAALWAKHMSTLGIICSLSHLYRD
jgi:hypothetical protein